MSREAATRVCEHHPQLHHACMHTQCVSLNITLNCTMHTYTLCIAGSLRKEIEGENPDCIPSVWKGGRPNLYDMWAHISLVEKRPPNLSALLHGQRRLAGQDYPHPCFNPRHNSVSFQSSKYLVFCGPERIIGIHFKKKWGQHFWKTSIVMGMLFTVALFLSTLSGYVCCCCRFCLTVEII